MKRFLTYLFLGLLFISAPSYADDIRDFQIEEMSTGDSALNYFTEDELNEGKEYYQNSKSKAFFLTNVYSSNFKTYDNIMFHFKDNDPAYIIHSISGAVFFEDDGIKNVEECMIERNKIDKELSLLFKDLDRQEDNDNTHDADITGKSMTHNITYWFAEGHNAATSCYILSKEFDGTSHLKVMVNSKDLIDWLNNEAY